MYTSINEIGRELPFSNLSLKSGCGAQSPFVTSRFCYRAALQKKQNNKSAQKDLHRKTAASSNERFALDMMGRAAGLRRCRRGGRGGGGGTCVIKCVRVWVSVWAGVLHVFVSLQNVCAWCGGVYGRCVRRTPGALPHRPVPKSCVQAVSNKLLNLIKRSGIILQSPRGARTSAIMNTFCLIIMLRLQSLPQEKLLPFWKSSCEPGWHLYKWTGDEIIIYLCFLGWR